MIRCGLAAGLALVAGGAQAADRPGPVVRPIGAFESTASGQPLSLPQGPVRVGVVEATLAPGGVLPAHKHPWPRYAYVLAGRIRVTNLDTGAVTEAKAGEFVIDPIGQWHEGAVVGDEPVRMITIDQAPPGQSNFVPRAP